MQLALTSMSYRLFRSGVTVSILALAVAFLVHMVSHGIVSQETERRAHAELGQDRKLGEMLTRLVRADNELVVQGQLQEDEAERLAELRKFAGDAVTEFEPARVTAQRLHALGVALQRLPVAAQSVLLADLSPAELFARLNSEAAVAAFSDNLVRVKAHLPGLSREQFRRLMLEERPVLLATSAAIVRGHEQAVAEVQRAYPGKNVAELAAAPPPDFAERLAVAGFNVRGAELQALQDFARREALAQGLAKLLLNSEVRAAVARETSLLPGDVSFEALLDQVADRKAAVWLLKALRGADSATPLKEEQVLALFDKARRKRNLLAAVGEAPEQTEVGVFGLSERNQWLIALSFLVCVVGVANAMLMSVTERFTEIATMKCLGAMDRFVMMLFVFEAVVQGVIGGVIGVVVGLALALLRGTVEFGTLWFSGFGATGELLIGVLLSFLVGIALAALAAIGPSWIAARLPPMEAMRVE